MSKTTLRNVKASVEVRELQDELSEVELKTVSGGRVMHGDFAIVKYLDKASPKFFYVMEKIMSKTNEIFGDHERRERSNARPSPCVACSTSSKPHNIIKLTSQSLP